MRINHHQNSDGRHERQHHRCERIHHVAHRQAETAGAGPHKQVLNRGGSRQLAGQDRVAQDSRGPHAGDQKQRNRFAQAVDRAVEADQTQAGDHSTEQG